jgi:hypothetical protein
VRERSRRAITTDVREVSRRSRDGAEDNAIARSDRVAALEVEDRLVATNGDRRLHRVGRGGARGDGTSSEETPSEQEDDPS